MMISSQNGASQYGQTTGTSAGFPQVTGRRSRKSIRRVSARRAPRDQRASLGCLRRPLPHPIPSRV